MALVAARQAPERFDRSTPFQRGGGQPYGKNIICKYWQAGTCNRRPCAFIHSNVLHSRPLRELNQAHSDNCKQTSKIKRNFNQISSTNVPSPTANISKTNTRRNPESTVFDRLTVSNNPVMAYELDRNQGIAKKIRANKVVGSNAESLKNIHAAVASRKAPSPKIDTDQRVPKDMGTTAESIGLVGAEVNTDQGAHSKILSTEGSGLPSCNAVLLNSPTKGCTQVETVQIVDNSQSKTLKLNSPASVGSVWAEVNTDHVAHDKILNTEGSGLPSHNAVLSNSPTKGHTQVETRQIVDNSQVTFCGSGFSMLTKLEGHTKAVSGVVLPSGWDKLFSASKDESIRMWDGHSGQCVDNVKLEGEIQCLHSEGQWVFAGLKNAVKAWNFQTRTAYVLNGPNGLVHSLASSDDMLFAGVQGGSIMVWKTNFGPDCPELKTTLKGHNLTVLSLTVGAKRLYSGSKDSTICVWDLESLECIEILDGHTDFVTSLICWDKCLLSGSLDKTLKVWATSECGKLEVVYEVKEESGIITLGGIMDAEKKPILLCSYKDSTVRLYDLPSFVERGRIFGKKEIQAIEIGWCNGLFFTGDATGQLSVWKLDGEFKPVTS